MAAWYSGSLLPKSIPHAGTQEPMQRSAVQLRQHPPSLSSNMTPVTLMQPPGAQPGSSLCGMMCTMCSSNG